MLSVLLYVTLTVPVSIVHELGHGLVCSSSGGKYNISIDFTGGHISCLASLQNRTLYYIMGGIFGTVAAAAMLGLYRFAIKNKALLIIGLAFLVDQVAKIIIEGFVTGSYLSGSLDVIITVVQLGALAAIMTIVLRKSYVRL